MKRTGENQHNQPVEAVDAYQLREIVVDRLYTIDDAEYLKALKKILDTGPAAENIYHTNPKQKEAIRQGKEQIHRGQFVTNEELEADEDKWLNA